jgi:hypothetical protein
MRGVRAVLCCLPLARHGRVRLCQDLDAGLRRKVTRLGAAPSPGDTFLVGERWFL